MTFREWYRDKGRKKPSPLLRKDEEIARVAWIAAIEAALIVVLEMEHARLTGQDHLIDTTPSGIAARLEALK